MSTVFFRKNKCVRWMTGVACITFTIGAILYAYFLTGAQTVGLFKTFYFLVSPSTHIQASTYFISLDGGAGYTLRYHERDYVAYSVYFTQTAVENACAAVSATGEETEIVAVSVEKLYFKTRGEKNMAYTVQNAMECLYDYGVLLNAEIARLDNGATQESSKRLLSTLARQFAHAGREYEGNFVEFSNVGKEFAGKIGDIVKDVVLVKDLRLLLCELCVSYMHLAESFRL